jgi:hypothetical protein
MNTKEGTMQKLLPAVAFALLFAAGGCREASEDVSAATKAAPAAAAVSDNDAPRPDIARPDIARPDIAKPDQAPRPDVPRPDIARPNSPAVQTPGAVGNSLPVYPNDAGVPKAPPDAQPLNR